MAWLNRSTLIALIAVTAFVLAPSAVADDPPSYPWTKSELLEPASLAQRIASGKDSPIVICVAFPALFRQRHILNAQYAGPGNSPDGLKSLTEAVAKLPKTAEITIYCGCCPMVRCPNLQPSFRTLKALGFSNVKVLELPTTLLADWTSKGYPVE